MYEWYEEKQLQNIKNHGMDFIDAVQIFDGRPAFTYISERNNEERFVTVGKIDGKLWKVVWQKRNKKKRIISAHRGSDGTERKYNELFGKGN
ncbi:MAG: BrnT family toxin [Pseudomonadota bacterium]